METKNGTKDTVYYGPAVDIWAVGVLAYELLAGRPPFEVEEERETAMRIMYHTDIEFPCYVSRNAQEFILTVQCHSPPVLAHCVPPFAEAVGTYSRRSACYDRR